MRLALALAVLLALPATASASKVSVVLADGCNGDVACSKSGGAPPVPVTTFEGAPGEANVVGVRREGGELVIRDDGAVLTAESPCTAVDAHSARCPVTPGTGGAPPYFEQATSPWQPSASTTETFEADAVAGRASSSAMASTRRMARRYSGGSPRRKRRNRAPRSSSRRTRRSASSARCAGSAR